MAEYIEREATVKLLRSIGHRGYRREEGTLADAIKMVMHSEYTPTADVAPVRHGRWIPTDMGGGEPDEAYVCSNCKAPWTTIYGTPAENNMHYCPHCGAKMDKEESAK